MASDDAVTTITESLKETEELPRKQIAEIVEALGAAVALELLAETRRVQDEGGLEVRDGTRRRTDGGVYFSLAKAKLPKAERNRIFRVKVPKAPGAPESEPKPAAPAAPAPEAQPVAVERRPARKEAPAGESRVIAPVGGGRRRVVEVEVLRHLPKPSAPEPATARPAAVPAEPARRELQPPQAEVRPLRRIVTVAPVVKQEPPSTPDAARQRIREMLGVLKVAEQRRVLADALRELGGNPEPEPKRPVPEPKKAPPPPPPPPRGLDDAMRERVLAAVTDALGLATADLARVLYGEETAGTKAKARTVLERWRRS